MRKMRKFKGGKNAELSRGLRLHERVKLGESL